MRNKDLVKTHVLVITINGGNYCPMATETGHIHRLVYLLLTNESKDCNNNDVDQCSHNHNSPCGNHLQCYLVVVCTGRRQFDDMVEMVKRPMQTTGKLAVCNKRDVKAQDCLASLLSYCVSIQPLLSYTANCNFVGSIGCRIGTVGKSI